MGLIELVIFCFFFNVKDHVFVEPFGEAHCERVGLGCERMWRNARDLLSC